LITFAQSKNFLSKALLSCKRYLDLDLSFVHFHMYGARRSILAGSDVRGVRRTGVRIAVTILSYLAPCFPCWAAAASVDEIVEMKHAIESLQAQNRALAKRVETLEAEKSAREAAAQQKRAQKKREEAYGQPTRAEKQKPPERPPEEMQTVRSPPNTERSPTTTEERGRLEQRVKELEIAKAAQEDATRSIIRDALSKFGSKINEYVNLGGNIEIVSGWSDDFAGQSTDTIFLNTAQLDFEIRTNEWTVGNLTVEYLPGTDTVFRTNEGFQTGSNRIALDTATVTIGDPQRFPLFTTLGQMFLPFGISTGHPVTDVLTAEDPLTIEVFEMRQVALGFGAEFPTPPLKPDTPPVMPPRVKPLVINPLFASLSKSLGYTPPPERPPPIPYSPKPDPPPFNAGVYFYQPDPFNVLGRGWRPFDHINATVGFRTKGHCGRPYDQLRATDFCPWSIDADIDYITSVFDSRFLEFQYQNFLRQIGTVPGMAASVKATVGPVALIGEWNGAISKTKFVDNSNNSVSITPAAWQVSLDYQFDWNPWVEEIGAQGTYFSVGYSQSQDLAGVRQFAGGPPVFDAEGNQVPPDLISVGSVPKRRLLLGVGEWVLEGLRVGAEYSLNWDYGRSEGGTGNSEHGIFSTITYVW
jgi:hypothetical protein